ncbi:MAG: T9SS type A sorting domain-containing protein [Bacteroidota bacterium]
MRFLDHLCLFVVLLFGFSLASPLYAQISAGGQPIGLQKATLEAPERLILPPVDRQTLAEEDAQFEAAGRPPRFGVHREVDIRLERMPHTTLPDGSRLSRVHIESVGARAIALYFNDFHLAKGVRVFAYTPDGRHVRGAFTSANNRELRKFAISYTTGQELILEVHEPAKVIGQSALHIDRIGHAYRNWRGGKQRRDFGSSDSCHVNANCSEGNNYREQQRSVGLIVIPGLFGDSGCTGALVGNTSFSNTPYFLTAEHCGGSFFGGFATPADLAQWQFVFNFEADSCENPASAAGLDDQSIIGSVLIARSDDDGGDTGSDLALLELLGVPPAAYKPYYAGWDANDVASISGVGIHHPAGDIKKISTYNFNLLSDTWGGTTQNTHWNVRWSPTSNGYGVTEGGSSGSPLFDSFGRIVGTLTGGGSFCDSPNSPDSYGKFSYHWESNGTASDRQLKPWLDPENTGETVIDGYDPYDTTATSRASVRESSLEIWPNPASEFVGVRLPNAEQTDGSVVLFDLNGRRVAQARLQQGDAVVPVDGLATGVYVLEVVASGQRSTRQLVIER